jgi:hypothetical protein
VAGVACYKFSTSNINLILLVILIVSPEVRHNFLLSSSKVLRFSTQTALKKILGSTGPSKMIHLNTFSSFYSKYPLRIEDMMPSLQFFVSISYYPYNWLIKTDFGFNFYVCIFM